MKKTLKIIATILLIMIFFGLPIAGIWGFRTFSITAGESVGIILPIVVSEITILILTCALWIKVKNNEEKK